MNVCISQNITTKQRVLTQAIGGNSPCRYYQGNNAVQGQETEDPFGLQKYGQVE